MRELSISLHVWLFLSNDHLFVFVILGGVKDVGMVGWGGGIALKMRTWFGICIIRFQCLAVNVFQGDD